MNVDEAAKVIAEMSSIASITKVGPLAPTDVIVVECEGYIEDGFASYLQAKLNEIWPGQRVLLMDKGLQIKVLPGA